MGTGRSGRRRKKPLRLDSAARLGTAIPLLRADANTEKLRKVVLILSS